MELGKEKEKAAQLQQELQQAKASAQQEKASAQQAQAQLQHENAQLKTSLGAKDDEIGQLKNSARDRRSGNRSAETTSKWLKS